MFSREIQPNDDCPNCGKKEGAYMGSTKWGHSVSCCSDACGEEINKKLKLNKSTNEYEKSERRLRKLESHLLKLKYKGIPKMELEDEIGEYRF